MLGMAAFSGVASIVTSGAVAGGVFAVSMGGQAAAISLSEANYFGANSDEITLTTAASAVTAIAVLDAEELQKVMAAGAPLAKYTLIDCIDADTNDIGLQTNYTSSSGKIVTCGMYGIWNQGGAYEVGLQPGALDPSFQSTDFWTDADSVAVVLTYSYGNGTTATFTMLDANGNVLRELGGTWTTSLRGKTCKFDKVEFDETLVLATCVFNQVVTAEDAKALGKEAATWAQTENFYWESGTSEWAGNKWALTDNGTPSVNLLLSETVNTYFNNKDETATITMSGAVAVTSMHIDAGNYTFQGIAAETDSVSADTLSVAAGATATLDKITITATTGITNNGTLTISDAVVNAAITNNHRFNITDATIDGSTAKITGTGSVVLSGAINLVNFSGERGEEVIPTDSNGFGTIATEYTVVSCTGGSSADGVTKWSIGGEAVKGTIHYSETGVLSVYENGTVYYVSVGEVEYATITGATSVALNGGTLVMGDTEVADGFITTTAKGGVVDLGGKELAQSKLGALQAATTLSGSADSVYDLGADTALAANLALSNANWKGTVKMGDVATPTADWDISTLGKDGSAIKSGATQVRSLQSRSGATVAAKSLTLGGGSSALGGDLTVEETLSLGNADSAAALSVTGNLSAGNGILLGNADSALTVGTLADTVLKVDDDAVFNELCSRAANGAITLLTVTGGTTANVEFLHNGIPAEESQGIKYTVELGWNGGEYQMQTHMNKNYVLEHMQASSSNAAAGVVLLNEAFVATNPQVNAPDGDLAALLNSVDDNTLTDEQAAAAAGSSTMALGMAFAGDVERQLRAIRNRTTTMGVNECVINEGMPYFNAWINAEGNMAELDQDGTMPGYTLDSWGGTVGFDVDVNPNLTLGLAVTAMYGDLKTDGPDMLDGDMDTYYVSAFARYSKRGWSHTFVATVGTMDTTYERTVSHAGGSYTTEGDTDGTAFGLMYEVGRAFTLDRAGDVAGQLVANVTYRHTTVSGYEETGRDAALKVDDQTLDTITFGVGGRMQAVVGKNMFNRTSLFEARALAKFDVGDRSSEADVAFLGGSRSATVESAELGAFGVELGAGLSIPVGDENDGTLFLDVSAELRSGYTNVNGTLGYRINF